MTASHPPPRKDATEIAQKSDRHTTTSRPWARLSVWRALHAAHDERSRLPRYAVPAPSAQTAQAEAEEDVPSYFILRRGELVQIGHLGFDATAL
jgi:hypothetical protein